MNSNSQNRILKCYKYVLWIFISCFISHKGSTNIYSQGDSLKLPFVEKPPMGWNSYNSFGAAVREEEVRANADYIAKNLKHLGYEYVVIDYCWFYPHPPESKQNNPPQFRLPIDGSYVPWLPMDEYGRLLPDPGKFPSAAGGKGFKPIADYVHSLGLKFGIHMMRGIPRQAVWYKSQIKNTSDITAAAIVDTTSECSWLNTMWGVDMAKTGSQEYYNSLFQLYADWGVDFVKLDDALNEPYHQAEIEAVKKAIIACGRPIVLSLSPSMRDMSKAKHVQQHSNMWRISDDFWDNWKALKAQFHLAEKWNQYRLVSHWPDLDMLQIGKLSRRGPEGPERYSSFSETELRTHLTLWSIYKSPLMVGGDLTQNRNLETDLLTNEEVIAVNQFGQNPRLLQSNNGLIIWISDSPHKNQKYVAAFNINDGNTQEVKISFKDLGIGKRGKVRDLWEKRDKGAFKSNYSVNISAHGSVLLSITGY